MAEGLESHQLLDDSGLPMDGAFDVEFGERMVALTLHARGGSKPGATTNRDYFDVLERILERMASAGASLLDALVDSRPARQLDRDARRLPLDYPIELEAVGDLHKLRIQMTEAQPDIASTRVPGSPGGNKHKRLRLEFDIDGDPSEVLNHLSIVGPMVDGRRRRDEFGSEYYDDPVDPLLDPSTVFVRDNSALERSLKGHAQTQKSLADYARGHGFIPRKRQSGDPDFDLAWTDGGEIVVVEVKSLSGANTSSQMRVGIGQVLEYRLRLALSQSRAVRAVLAVENDPGDMWHEICRSADVLLSWPPKWPRLFGDGLERDPGAE